MTEGGVGLVRHAAEFGVRDLAGDERADHLDRDLPIGTTEEAGDGVSRELRPGGRHIQAAIAGEPGQHHVAEAEFGGLAPGRDITSQTALQRPAEPELDPQAFDFTKLLVNSQRLWATIKCFAASGNRFAPGVIQRKGLPTKALPTKRAAAMPQPSLGRSVVVCRPVWPLGVTDPQKLFAQAFVGCHDIVKGQNGMCEKMFLFFPTGFGSDKHSPAASHRTLPLYPERQTVRERTTAALIVSADGVGAIHALPG